MNLDELERDMIRAAQRELAPSSADRERHQAALLARLGGGFSSAAAGSVLGAAGRRGAAGAAGALSHAGSSLRSSRVGMLGVGLIIGAIVGGWVGVGIGSRDRSAAAPAAPGAGVLARPGSNQLLSGAPASERAAVVVRGAAEGATAEPLGAVQHLDAGAEPSERDSLSLAETSGERESGVEGKRQPGIGPGRRGAAHRLGVVEAAPTSSLAAELAMLQRARRALNARNGQLALGIVQDLDERFPKGVLIEERDATRVLSLCQLERTDEARTVARSFLERYPVSVYAERVRRSCVAAPE